MTARIDITSKKAAIRLPRANKGLIWGLILTAATGLVLIGLINSSRAFIPVTGQANSRAMAAWTARYQGLADFEAAQRANIERANAAWAGRYQAQADAYALRSGLPSRARSAYTARLQGLALAEAERNVRANAAYSARLRGLAEEVIGRNARVNSAYTQRLQGLADWYASEK